MAAIHALYASLAMSSQGPPSVGSSGSSTDASVHTSLALPASTVKCLRRMLNRPEQPQVKAYSRLIWSILKLSKDEIELQTFCQQFRTCTSDVQYLLEWASTHFQAAFDGRSTSVQPDQQIFNYIKQLECNAVFLAAHAGSSSVLHSRASGPLIPDTHQPQAPIELAKVAAAVINGFQLMRSPPKLSTAPEPAVRRRLNFAASLGTFLTLRSGPSQPNQAPSKPRPSHHLPDTHSDLADNSTDDASAGCIASTPRIQALHASQRNASYASITSLRHGSHASLTSLRKRSGTSAATGTKVSIASIASLAEQDAGGSIFSDQTEDLQTARELSAFLAGRAHSKFSSLPASPTHTPPSPTADLAAAGKRRRKMLSVLKNLVVPSCIRTLSPAQPHSLHSSPSADDIPSSSASKHHKPPLHSGHSHMFERQGSFELWIRAQQPDTPTPSFIAPCQLHSSSTASSAQRTALWVHSAVAELQPGGNPVAEAVATTVSQPEPVLDAQIMPSPYPDSCSDQRSGSHCASADGVTEATEDEDSWASWASQHHTFAPLPMPDPCHTGPNTNSTAGSTCGPTTRSTSTSAATQQHTLSFAEISAPLPLPDPTPDSPETATPDLDSVPANPLALPPSPAVINTTLSVIPPPEIMDPFTPGSISRPSPFSPPIAFLRRSVGSWASDSPTTSTPQANPFPDRPASPFSNRAASWASELSQALPSSSPPFHPSISPVRLMALSSIEQDRASTSRPASPTLTPHLSNLRRDSWSSDYSAQSPMAARPSTDPASTVFASSHLQPTQPHTQPPSTLQSMRSLPQIPSRLGSRRHGHLSRATSGRTGALAAINTSFTETDAIDDTGDSAAPGANSGSATDADNPPPVTGERTQSQESDIDTHFFSDRGTTMTLSTDLDSLAMLVPGYSGLLPAAATDSERLHNALSAPDPIFHMAVTDALLVEQQVHGQVGQDVVEVPVAAVEQLSGVPGVSHSDHSDGSGRGGLSGLSIRLVFSSSGNEGGVSSEEEEAPETLRHFGSFTGSTEPGYLAGTRLPGVRGGLLASTPSAQ